MENFNLREPNLHGEYQRIQESNEAFGKFLRDVDFTGVYTIREYGKMQHFMLELVSKLEGFAWAQDAWRQVKPIEIAGVAFDYEKSNLSVWDENENGIKINPLRMHLSRNPEPIIVITPKLLGKSIFESLVCGDSLKNGSALDLTRKPYVPMVILPYGSELLSFLKELSPYAQEKPKISTELRRLVYKDFLESL